MEVVLLKKAQKDRDYWKQTGNVKIIKRITELLKDIEQHPFTGKGKPEPRAHICVCLFVERSLRLILYSNTCFNMACFIASHS